MARILALDWGEKRVGVAVTDPLQMIASPLDTIDTKEIFTFLTTYFLKEKVEIVVVGLPKNLDNTISLTEQMVTGFIEKLQKRFPTLKIETMDERFTSKMASQTILSSGLKKSDRQNKSIIDKVSAAIILQSFLERKSFFS